MRLTADQKKAFLKLVFLQRDLLFNKFDGGKITVKSKENAWKKIISDCKTINDFDPIPSGKTWSYARDKIYANLRDATIKKRDKKAQTGAAGGNDLEYSEIDGLVLDIIGRNSPAVMGLPLNQQWDKEALVNPLDGRSSVLSQSTADDQPGTSRTAMPDLFDSEEELSEANYTQPTISKKKPSSTRKRQPSSRSSDDDFTHLRELKKKYYETHIAYLESMTEKAELEKEKLRLEISMLRKQDDN